MGNIFRKIIQILDGTPAVYGQQNRSRGQSVVELALVSPILIVLLMGLAEIGWFANNYLILLEVTRVGARLGTTQTGETSPLAWNNDMSRYPGNRTAFNDTIAQIGPYAYSETVDCTDVSDPNKRELRGFYNFIACVMLQQMDPLEFRAIHDVNALNVSQPDDPSADPPYIRNTDDIVISAFSLMAIDPDDLHTARGFKSSSTPPYNLLQPSRVSGMGDLPQVIVVGRYPTNANECTVDVNGTTPRTWERDPFDYFTNTTWDYQLKDGIDDPPDRSNRNYVELDGYDAQSYPPYENASGAQPPAMLERQRGWSLTGNHIMSESVNPLTGIAACLGSEWSIAEVEALMNVPGFSLLDLTPDEKSQRERLDRLPSQGLVLVELFWRHELLLKNPVFNPVWTILGDRTTVSVWAAFPLPTTEPRISIR